MSSHPIGSEHHRFEDTRRQFEAIAQTCVDRLHVCSLDLAGAHVRLRLVGDALAAALLESFAHLRVPALASRPDLQIDVWAEDESGQAALSPPSTMGDGPGLAMDGGVLEVSSDERYLVYRVGTNSVSWLDRRAARIVASVRRTNDLLLRQRVKPFGTLLALWLHDRGIRVMHAAAIADGERAVLLPGQSGSGKSTCATVCVEAGMHYLADDTVALEETGDGSFVAHSLFGGARLWPADGGLLPQWSSQAIQPDDIGDDAKLLLFIGRRHEHRLLARATIVALAFPRIMTQTHTRVRPMARPEALRTLVATCLFLRVKPQPEDVEHMLRLVTRVPAFALELGTDRSQIPAAVEQCLRADGGSHPGTSR